MESSGKEENLLFH